MQTFVIQWNARRTLRFQVIPWVNMIAMRVQLHSFQSPTNASVVSPVSDRIVAHSIVQFCNCFNAVRKTDNRRMVESFYIYQQNENETEH